MQFVNINFSAPAEAVIEMLSDSERVNHNVRFDQSRGKPLMKLKDKGNGKIKISCEMIGGPSKDNGFIQGTKFSGRLTEKNGVTRLKGVITTEPIYHLILLALVVVFIIQCIKMNGFSIVPPLIILFDWFMFKNEFKKQGYIKRYIFRAAARIEKSKDS